MGNKNSTPKAELRRFDEAIEALEERRRAYEKKYEELVDKEKQKVHQDQPSQRCLDEARDALEEEKRAYEKKYKELVDKEKQKVHQVQPRTHVATHRFTSVSEAHQRASCSIYPNLQKYDFPSTSSGCGDRTHTFYSGIASLPSAPPVAPPEAPQETLTNTNIHLEAHHARTNFNRHNQKRNCPNTKDGCSLSLYPRDLAAHKKECPFNEMPCPVNDSNGCNWRGKLNQLKPHFQEYHPEHCVADVDKEMKLPNINEESYIVYLVVLGTFNFLVHLRVDKIKSLTMMTVQMIGTKMSAEKWSYQFHVYNKLTPRRKYQYNAVCHSNMVPVMEIFDKLDCATLNAIHVKSFANNSHVTYKFYLKKDFNKKTGEWSQCKYSSPSQQIPK